MSSYLGLIRKSYIFKRRLILLFKLWRLILIDLFFNRVLGQRLGWSLESFPQGRMIGRHLSLFGCLALLSEGVLALDHSR